MRSVLRSVACSASPVPPTRARARPLWGAGSRCGASRKKDQRGASLVKSLLLCNFCTSERRGTFLAAGESTMTGNEQAGAAHAAETRWPLSMLEFEHQLFTVALEAAENGDRLSIDLCGGGYAGCYPAAAQGDPTAIIVRDMINIWLQRLFGPPPQAGLPCLTCTQPLDPPHREGAVIVTARASVSAP